MPSIQPVFPADWGTYRPAEITIRMKSAEMETDWTSVFYDMELKRPITVAKELGQAAMAKAIEDVAIKAQEGDRMMNIAAGEKNVFGKIAHDRYMRNGQKEITVEAIPHQGVLIDFRIYPPEITVDPRGALPK
ncbi:hypothetical protein SAMN02744102_02322 [Paenibacillus barengoltzii]|jgi:hypothetical protein|uniref:DUF6470 family protein n=1 Tax=Paenibacillus barengoltzii TaxID=343517 RepID=UPI000A08AE0A|nr:DUF6470 family protein [Paenibacillus barengoltzii]SMF27041.1 hypothetical protein SAMN02744102_02322 [Paenibacillus barengoltzii]